VELRALLANDLRAMVDTHLQQARAIAGRLGIPSQAPTGPNGQTPVQTPVAQ
jgi:hypothetical protein